MLQPQEMIFQPNRLDWHVLAIVCDVILYNIGECP